MYIHVSAYINIFHYLTARLKFSKFWNHELIMHSLHSLLNSSILLSSIYC